jgi:hypothetical protein
MNAATGDSRGPQLVRLSTVGEDIDDLFAGIDMAPRDDDPPRSLLGELESRVTHRLQRARCRCAEQKSRFDGVGCDDRRVRKKIATENREAGRIEQLGPAR